MEKPIKKNSALIAKKLGVLWAISYVILAIVSTGYTHFCAINGDLSPSTPASPYQVITTLLVVFYFLPILLGIHHHAKLAKMRKMLLTVRIILGVLLYWLICVFSMWAMYFSQA